MNGIMGFVQVVNRKVATAFEDEFGRTRSWKGHLAKGAGCQPHPFSWFMAGGLILKHDLIYLA